MAQYLPAGTPAIPLIASCQQLFPIRAMPYCTAQGNAPVQRPTYSVFHLENPPIKMGLRLPHPSRPCIELLPKLLSPVSSALARAKINQKRAHPSKRTRRKARLLPLSLSLSADRLGHKEAMSTFPPFSDLERLPSSGYGVENKPVGAAFPP